MLKRVTKSIAKALLGRYRLLRIYRVNLGSLPSDDTIEYDLRRMVSNEEMLLAEDPVIRDHAFFAKGKADVFGLWENGKLACSCVIWDAEQFTDTIIGDLANTGAILVDIVTAESDRQRGFALATIRFAMMEMARKGYQSMVCTIWHNNHASIKAFERAGWRYSALVAEVFPLGRRFTFRFEKYHPRLSIPWTRPMRKTVATLERGGFWEMLSFLRKKLIRTQKSQVYIASCANAKAPNWLPDETVYFSSCKEPWDSTISAQLVALGTYNEQYLEAVSHGEAEGVAVLCEAKIVHYAYLMYRNKTTDLLGFERKVGLLGHAFTVTKYRGRGCQTRSVMARIKMAQQAGLDNVISATSYENIPSHRGLTAGGMKLFGRVELLVLLNVLVFRYRRPDKSIKWIGFSW